MSFFTSLTGLNAATAQLGVTSNNIANASTVGFKRSRADFGDIFATSPLQKASATIGQGVSLKGVTQEFGQGNLNFSSNTLDLAISGSGFFPLKSADGFQDIFTRNGTFMMNDQYNVVNAAGQRLMAATVDSTGKANLNDMNVLTIPQKTVGMAKETSSVQLGLNFPADAPLIVKPFNRNDPATYNKSTAMTVYDKGGNGYLATIYYAKSQNASQTDPTNKWQTYVYVGDTLVAAALQQATNSDGQPLYVNKYGELKPESEVADFLTNAKTQKFALNDLKDLRTSLAATVTGESVLGLSSLAGVDFTTLKPNDLRDLFSIDIDGSGKPVSIGLDHLAGLKNGNDDLVLNGEQIAKELTNVINRKFGDEQLFNFKAQQNFQITSTLPDGTLTQTRTIQLDDNNMTYEQVVAKINSQLKGSSSVLSNVGFSNDPQPDEFKGYAFTIGGKQVSGKIDLGKTLGAKPMSDLVSALQSTIQADLVDELGYTDAAASKVTVNLQNYNDATKQGEIRITDGNDPASIVSSLTLSAISIGKPNKFENSKALLGLSTTPVKGDYTAFSFTIDGLSPINISTVDIDPNGNLNTFATKLTSKLQSALTDDGALFDVTKVTVSVDDADPTKLVFKDTSGNPIRDVSLTARIGGDTPLLDPTLMTEPSTISLQNIAFAANSFGTGLNQESLLSHFKSLDVSITPSPTNTPVSFTIPFSAAIFPDLTDANGTHSYATFNPNNPGDTDWFASSIQTAVQTAFGVVPGAANLKVTWDKGGLKMEEKVPDGAVAAGFFIGKMQLNANDSYDATLPGATYYAGLQKGSAETSFYKEPSSTGTVYPSYLQVSNVSYPMDTSALGDEFKSFNLTLGDTTFPTQMLGDITPISNTPMNDLANRLQTKIQDYLTSLQDATKFPESRIKQITVSVINGKDLKISDLGGMQIKDFSLNKNPGSTNQLLVSNGSKSLNIKPLPAVNQVTASFDPVTQKFNFQPLPGNNITVGVGKNEGGINTQLGIAGTLTMGAEATSISTNGSPDTNGNNWARDPKYQRFGAVVEYDGVNQKFNFKSGTTGDTSSIEVINTGNVFATNRLGLNPATTYSTGVSIDAVRGIESKPALLMSNPMGINPNNNFSVDVTNNKFIVSVDDVKGTIYIEPKDNYTIDSFTAALQNAINRLAGPADIPGLTGSNISGVKVTYDKATNKLAFTSGSATSNSFIKVSGAAQWGLANLDGTRGTTTTWIKPTQYTETVNGSPVAMYIDEFGKETVLPSGFKQLPAWSPVYLEKGELTFDTSGNLVSPKVGSQLDTVFLPDGKGSLKININYGKSTQLSSPYSVLSQSQDGAPEGDLVGLSIGDDGLVNASYSNSSQKSLGKVVLVNFSNPSGLRQIGDTSYYKSANSGVPKYGEAGSAGYGTVKSGATERANVDLTQELVDLITEQRNFQANAKAIETSTTLTQSIIQIRA